MLHLLPPATGMRDPARRY